MNNLITKFINNEFHVISDRSNNHYTITRDLVCNCKAGKHKKFPCSHVNQVLEDISKGLLSKHSVGLAKEQGFMGNHIMMRPEEAIHY